MPTRTASTADDIADSIRALIDRVADAKITQEMARRGQDMAIALGERGTEVGDFAADAWRDSRPARRDAAKRLERATADAARWSDKTWRKSLRPALRDLWSRRGVAIGAAGAAVPASRELVDTAAARLGLRQREERHWGAFFVGLLIGAAAGMIGALLLAPKRGTEMRRELATRADEVRTELSTRADEIVTKAKDADWVPIFQRELGPDGQPAEVATESVDAIQEGAAEAGTAAGEVAQVTESTADAAADQAAESINEAYDTVDRDSRP